jgi:hypothetical protein
MIVDSQTIDTMNSSIMFYYVLLFIDFNLQS